MAPSRLAIYNPSAQVGLGKNPFGKDVANMGLWRALAQHGGFDQIDVLANARIDVAQISASLLDGRPSNTRFTTSTILDQRTAAAAGALVRGKAELADMAWLRRTAVGDKAYSLLGLVHTLAPPVIREYIAKSAFSPLHEWDALICTSPSVVQALSEMFDAVGDFAAERFGGARRPRPHLPLVPLGVDLAAMRAAADRPEARKRVRAGLGLGDDDVLVLWVGRLSFFEKAYPQPMFRAVEEAAKATGGKVVFQMAGWFPVEPRHRDVYRQAAEAYAPTVDVQFIDGNDRQLLADTWAAADVFISLVDNVQETFGITPIEAMAAGLPVVASDWDGYRYTIEHGVQGFLIPTLGPPPGGLGPSIAAPHLMLLSSYQNYVGTLAQHTAVHVGKAAEALAALIRSPELRRRMGEAGRERVRAHFDWAVVAGLYRELVEELGRVRAAAQAPQASMRMHPAKGDPFADFAHFASHVLGPQTRVRIREGASPADLDRAARVDLDGAYPAYRAGPGECAAMLGMLAGGASLSVAELTARFPPNRRASLELGLTWMAKIGIVDWLEPEA
ncbi:glycosyltransferase family 4 protein [Phenylobacterium terrae]|uniref:Glycosyltransferase family 4 protein n=1 Tax=Phenylobacterium terrae TaxID=2665495 RepID=A0ABW4N328_9CAUL